VIQTFKLADGHSETKKVAVALDPTTLEGIAHVTGGTFFKATSAQQLTQVYRT